jgi:hypothetical protein
MLCDSTNWDEKTQIFSKYLKLSRLVLKGHHQKDLDINILNIFEMITIVIKKALQKISMKI